MTLETAVQKIIDTMSMENRDAARIARILAQNGAPSNVPHHVFERIIRAGKALKAIGIK